MRDFTWPADELPEIMLAMENRHPVCDYDTRHCMSTHALHLYKYSGRMRIDGDEFDFFPGDVTITPALSTAAYRLTAPGSHLVIHFKRSTTSTPGRRITLPLLIRAGSHPNTAVLDRLRLLISTYVEGGGSVPEYREAAAHLLLHTLLYLSAGETAPRLRHRAAEAALAYIEAHLTDECPIEKIVRNTGFSQNYLAREFRRSFGRTMHEYLQERRMEMASHYLASTNLRVSEISGIVGIADPRYFNRLFKKEFGCTPLAYRTVHGAFDLAINESFVPPEPTEE